jgi:uncharacterized surface protein with fasciclin (FAS1) repeats
LSGEGPFTFLAPTDSAFSKLDEEDLKILTEDKRFAVKVLRQHILPGNPTLPVAYSVKAKFTLCPIN